MTTPPNSPRRTGRPVTDGWIVLALIAGAAGAAWLAWLYLIRRK